jgi:hypothetical protein
VVLQTSGDRRPASCCAGGGRGRGAGDQAGVVGLPSRCADLRVIRPARTWPAPGRTNNSGLVRAQRAGVSVLLAGDAEIEERAT